MKDEIEEPDESLEGETPDAEQLTPEVSYEITSYGSDPEVEVLVGRLRKGSIVVPPFQRDYVWRLPEASKFIESLLLGLPVPGIFLAVDPESGKQIVIDGQQRLKSLLFYFDGYFNPKPEDKNRRVFSLSKVQKQFEGKTFSELDDQDRMRLETSIVHATIVKQTSPPKNDTSLYHIFERLNSGGTRLTPHEMRVALYHGPFVEKVKVLNDFDGWRKIFGKRHSRLKDQELIVRYFAMLEKRDKYARPMGEFLTKYVSENRAMEDGEFSELSSLFRSTISVFHESLDSRLFRITNALNVSVFDSCMVGLSVRLMGTGVAKPIPEAVSLAYESLLSDDEYVKVVSRSTADDAFVEKRMKLAIDAFKDC